MKKYLLRLCLLLIIYQASITNAKAQWVSIPDTAFVSYLQATFPTCMNGNQMDTTCSDIVNVSGVYCANKPIRDLSGIEHFDNLDTLDCQNDSLITLSVLPGHLRYLNCFRNKLTSLPSLPDSLTYFNCRYNKIPALPVLPPSLNYLNCNYNTIAVLPTLPSGIYYFDCGGNQLTSLPALPLGLNFFDCTWNHLTFLPSLPSGLISLDCSNNPLNTLPLLPIHLKVLQCNYNHLYSLPPLPDSLVYLTCNYNSLVSLPELPDSLFRLECSYNPITCLPPLKKIKYFDFVATAFSCLPNYPIYNFSSSSPLALFPLCIDSNPNGCSIYKGMTGKTYLDSFPNCQLDTIEFVQRSIHVNLKQNGNILYQTFTSDNGRYSFVVSSIGIFEETVDTIGIPFTLLCPVNNLLTDTITSADSLHLNRDFAFACKSGFDLVAQSISGRFRPGNTSQLNINAGDLSNFYGVHCAVGVSGTVELVMNGAVTYISPASGALTPTNVSGDTVTWNIADFGTVNFFSDFNIMVRTDTNAQIGSLVCFSLVVNPIVGDNNPSNNSLDYCGVVVASIDPNEKEVYPTGNIDTAQRWLTYTIHFQNTGTAEAQHIYVTDTLDSAIDPASFQLLAYSHQPMVQIKENAVRFNFPNINLPDSNTNEPLSHGYVQYKVKLKDNLPVGTNISNTAFIYFDFNSPVGTNTVSNTISTITDVAEFGMRNAEFGMNPNPANSFVNISMEEKMIGSNFAITDITGRRMMCVTAVNSAFRIPTSALSNGVYFVTVENERGRVTRKLVVER